MRMLALISPLLIVMTGCAATPFTTAGLTSLTEPPPFNTGQVCERRYPSGSRVPQIYCYTIAEKAAIDRQQRADVGETMERLREESLNQRLQEQQVP